MTQALAIREKAQALVTRISSDEFKRQVALALPGDVTPARFVRAAHTALLASPEIAECEAGSVFNSLLKAAQDGLLCDGREAALAPFKDKKTGMKKAQYLPMIGGYRKIAAEDGWQIITKVVYEADEFEHEEGLNPRLVHHPARPGVERGEIVAAYAIGRKRGEEPMFEVMDREEIEKVRKSSRASFGPWFDWFERMCEKTPGRRLFKKLPLGDRERVRRILERDPGEATALLYGPQAHQLTSAPESADVPSTSDEELEPGTVEGDVDEVEEAGGESVRASAGPASSAPTEEPPLEGEVVEERSKFDPPKSARAKAARIKELGATPVMGHESKTLADVKPDGEWFEWALQGGSPQWSPEFRAIFEEFVQLAYPDKWEEYQTNTDGQMELG